MMKASQQPSIVQAAQELVRAGLVTEARINGAEAYTAIEYLSVQ